MCAWKPDHKLDCVTVILPESLLAKVIDFSAYFNRLIF
jgi:hypothetical protein